MFSDPKYSFSICPKIFFVIQSKVNIFHQIQPRDDDGLWVGPVGVEGEDFLGNLLVIRVKVPQQLEEIEEVA